jgi:hypothetical protein
MSNLNKAVLKLAKTNPEFREALQTELRKSAKAQEGTPPAVAKAVEAVGDSLNRLEYEAKKLQKLFKRHPVEGDDWGRGAEAESQVDFIVKMMKAVRQSPIVWSLYADSPMNRK